MSQPSSQDSPANKPSQSKPDEAASSGTAAQTTGMDTGTPASDGNSESAVAPASPVESPPPEPKLPDSQVESPVVESPVVESPVAESPVAESQAPVQPAAAADAAVTPPAAEIGITIAAPEQAAPKAEAPSVDMNAVLDASSAAGADAGLLQVKEGDKVSGVLVRLGDDNCFIDFGGRSEGMIRTTELHGEDGKLAFAVGEPLEAFVMSHTDSGVVLSRFVSGEARQADTLYKAYKGGIPIEGRVMAINKWGLGVDLEGLRSFCPVSQVDTEFTEDLEQYRDKTMTFKIIRFRDRGRSIVLSRRALLEAHQEQEAEGVREQIVTGATVTGTVTRLENFGAFVDLGSRVEGLIHVSEMRHERVNHPKDVVQPGEEVTVKIIATKDLGDRRKERISLSIKALETDPWDEIKKQFRTGSVTQGKVEALEEYGAFVELAPGVRGLVHVSELADRRVNHPRDVVAIGDEVKIAVMEIDNKRKRLRLSMRRAEQVEGETNLKEFTERQRQEQAAEGAANTSMFEALKRAKLVE